MRRSISAKSAASTPPAPARIVTTAGRSSYSPSSRVCTSSSPDHLLQLRELGARLVGGVLVARLVGELDEHLEVVETPLDAVDAGELRLPVAERARDLLRLLGVVPEVGHTGLIAQSGDLGREAVDVDDGTDVAEGGAQRIDVGGETRVRA